MVSEMHSQAAEVVVPLCILTLEIVGMASRVFYSVKKVEGYANSVRFE